MAEVIGVASGALQVAEIGFSLATTLYKYASDVKMAKRDLETIAVDVEITSKVLKQTDVQLKKDPEISSTEATQVAEQVLKGCRRAFDNVLLCLNASLRVDAITGQASMSTAQSLKWPLQAKKMDVFRGELEKQKGTLVLMLSVLALGQKVTASTTSGSADVQARYALESLQIQSLQKASEESAQRHTELIASLAEMEIRLLQSKEASSAPLVDIPRPTHPYNATSSNVMLTTVATQKDRELDPIDKPIAKPNKTQQPGSRSPEHQLIMDDISIYLPVCKYESEKFAAAVNAANAGWKETSTLNLRIIALAEGSVKRALRELYNLSADLEYYQRPAPYDLPPSLGGDRPMHSTAASYAWNRERTQAATLGGQYSAPTHYTPASGTFGVAPEPQSAFAYRPTPKSSSPVAWRAPPKASSPVAWGAVPPSAVQGSLASVPIRRPPDSAQLYGSTQAYPRPESAQSSTEPGASSSEGDVEGAEEGDAELYDSFQPATPTKAYNPTAQNTERPPYVPSYGLQAPPYQPEVRIPPPLPPRRSSTSASPVGFPDEGYQSRPLDREDDEVEWGCPVDEGDEDIVAGPINNGRPSTVEDLLRRWTTAKV